MIKPSLSPLEQVKADRVLVEDLYAHGKFDQQTKRLALDLLYPPNQWGPWISKILLSLGTSLILIGLIFFFAFNWAKIEAWQKLASIQVGLIACLFGAYFYGLKRLPGKLFLLSATVLTGIFMAVFGQIYQTGADAYQLFMMWSLLSLGWTVISRFSVQWLCWHVITMTFLVLWWDQGVLPTRSIEAMIFGILMLFNGLSLFLAEYLGIFKKQTWVQVSWLRIIFLVLLLFNAVLPVLIIIVDAPKANNLLVLMAVLGFLILGLASFVYWKKIPSAWAISLCVLAAAIIVETFLIKQLTELKLPNVVMFLIAGIITLTVFGGAGLVLRKVLGEIRGHHV